MVFQKHGSLKRKEKGEKYEQDEKRDKNACATGIARRAAVSCSIAQSHATRSTTNQREPALYAKICVHCTIRISISDWPSSGSAFRPIDLSGANDFSDRSDSPDEKPNEPSIFSKVRRHANVCGPMTFALDRNRGTRYRDIAMSRATSVSRDSDAVEKSIPLR